MKKLPFNYIKLPIYSVHADSMQIATYKNKVIFSGGGGHGITNEIIIFEGSDMKKELNKIETQNDLIENMVVNFQLELLACSSNEDGYVRAKPGCHRFQIALRRLVHENRLHTVPVIFHNAPEDVSPFGPEQAAGSHEIAVAHAVIGGDTRIACTVDALDSHSSP